jgi:hypothetical protein
LWRALLALLASVLLACAAAAQAPQTQPQPAQPPPQAQQAPEPEHKITAAEAKELFAAVDAVLRFDSQDSALPLKHEVKRRLVTRDEVQAYIEERLCDDEDAQRLKNGEVVLKKFGLLPRDFNLDSFLVALLKEQVAGYYDPKTKMVNLLDWLGPEAQMPVMAHELTHALQDQSYDMEKWVRGDRKKSDVVSDEEMAARHAVLEGQAMAVMIDWILAPTGGSLLKSPMLVDAIKAGMGDSSGSPLFDRAPLYLKRMLLFPYTYGLDFERELLAHGGPQRAYAGVFERPPQSTREIMQPDVYLAGEKLPPLLPPPELGKTIGKDWEKYDEGSVGEFDVACLAEQFADAATAKKIYPNWRGGYYFAVKRKGVKTPGTADIGLVFVSRWANADSAKDFANVYSASIPRRYTVHGAVAAGFGETSNTSEGRVSIARAGNAQNTDVIVIESFDQGTTSKVTALLSGTASTAP